MLNVQLTYQNLLILLKKVLLGCCVTTYFLPDNVLYLLLTYVRISSWVYHTCPYATVLYLQRAPRLAKRAYYYHQYI
jgi:hypothetical protein